MADNLIELNNISKSFGGVNALIDVNLEAKEGQVRAIIGENGAGKSTLMKIISGALKPDKGEIFFRGDKVTIDNPKQGQELGISIVYQEPVFYPFLTVTENFFLNNELTSKIGNIQWGKMRKEVEKALEKFNLPSKLAGKSMSSLAIGTQQLILIAKAMYQNPEVMIFDEPTSILSQEETQILFERIKKLKEEGTSILYISHRIEEIYKIADEITILRNGEVAGRMGIEDANDEIIIQKMSGKKLDESYYKESDYQDNQPLIEVNDLSKKDMFEGVSFNVKPGEILGFYGLVGSGRSEVARTLFGDIKRDRGKIIFEGQDFNPNSCREAINNGIAYLPEDRGTQGLFPSKSIIKNITTAILPWISKNNFIINDEKELEVTQEYYNDLNIKSSSIDADVKSLSGGNQQKVMLGRWLATEPKLLILDEPTRGIDVATKSEVYKLILELARQNIAIMCISSDLDDILKLADNIAIMNEGELVEILPREETDEEEILRLALGVSEKAETSPAGG